MLRGLSVIDPPFLVGLGLLTAVVFAASWFHLRRRWLRWGIRGLGVVLAMLMAAAGVNARYAYLPTLAAVFGQRASEQVSPGTLRVLEGHRAEWHGAGHAAGVGLAIAHGSTELSGAGLRHGVVVAFRIPAPTSHFHARTAEVYLPPAYFRSPRPRLPVIELLHGTPGSPADWTRGGFADVTADDYAAAHQGFAPVLVMPDVNGAWTADSECVDGRRGRAQTYLTVDVRNAVVSRFHTRRDANGWAIAGLSEGGYCALQIALRHPTMYGAVGDFSGENGPSVAGGIQRLFSGTWQQAEHRAAQYDAADLLRRWDGAVRPAVWFEVGSADGTLRTITNLDLLAIARGFDTRFVMQQGADHSFASWRDAFRDALPWLTASFGASPAAEAARRA